MMIFLALILIIGLTPGAWGKERKREMVRKPSSSRPPPNGHTLDFITEET